MQPEGHSSKRVAFKDGVYYPSVVITEPSARRRLMKKPEVGRLVRVLPGGRKALYETASGVIRKPFPL